MGSFEYEWWTVSIRFPAGVCVCEYKGKSKESVIRQINREIKQSNSKENLELPIWKQKQQILQVYWETLKLDRKGYQRLF